MVNKTALAEAALWSRLEVAAAIFDARPGHVDPNLAGSSGSTPLLCAVYRGDADMVRLLLARGQGTRNGIDVNLGSVATGQFPLGEAAGAGDREIVKVSVSELQLPIYCV